MAQDNKKRRIISYENMVPELAEAFAEKYPRGFNDYLSDIVRYTKPDGTPFFAVTMEDAESIYLIKVKVKVDGKVIGVLDIDSPEFLFKHWRK